MTLSITTTAKRTILASLALTLSAGLTACSSDSSSGTDANKAGDNSSTTSAQPQAQTQSAPAWLVGGKVDIRKVDPTDVQAPCDALLGSAKEAAQSVKVDANHKTLDPNDTYQWVAASGFWYRGLDNKGPWYRLTCQPALTEGRSTSDVPGITVSMREDPSKGTVEGNDAVQYDPTFGHGATKYTVVGKATIYSTFDFKDPFISTSTNRYMNKSSDMDKVFSSAIGNDKLSLPEDPSIELTKAQYINKLKENNAKVAAVTAPLIDRAAEHVYGG